MGMEMTSLKLHHVGESIVSEMLQDLADKGNLGDLGEALASSGLSGPLKFTPDRAYLLLEWNAEQYTCDGAQKADILCVGSGDKAVALELKLGLTRMSATAFEDRFLKPISQSGHADKRVKGSLAALLDRRVEDKAEGIRIQAFIGSQRWEVAETWWLVVRRSVWQRWAETRMPNLRHGRILILDDLVQNFGGKEDFNSLVRELVCADYYDLWKFRP